MKYIILSILLLKSIYAFGQNTSSVNSGAIQNNNLMHSVGEVFVISNNENNISSGIIAVTTQIEFFTLGTEEILLSEDIRVYPNPANHSLNLNINKKIKKIFIYNTSGQLVSEQILNNANRVNLTNLSKGIYFLKTENPNIKSIKIIKK
ncbi:T9SS type A sorting domain-containing protein [Tenacibaculum sp. 190524A05c]|uniref:T9SS type A sorting domain-containing protein n=1 Tax=Tenacibaculum platacis TaxID=3137852 RepID=UPI0032B13BC5